MYHVGIEKIRRAVEEANEQKKVAAKQRDRVAPKMGRMDVDYQVRDAASVYAIDATRLHLTMTWVVSFSILSRFGRHRGGASVRESAAMFS